MSISASSTITGNRPNTSTALILPSIPVNLLKWNIEHPELFQFPVRNRLVFGNEYQFKIMVVVGPNCRSDFHINKSEEWFHQLQGDMVLKIVDEGKIRDIIIKEGEGFLLPPEVPHSPQRFENTVGLVIEFDRPEDVMDLLRWYCPECSSIIKEFELHCKVIDSQLGVVMTNYFNSESDRVCKACSYVDFRPTRPNQNIYKGNFLSKSASNFDSRYPTNPISVHEIVNLSDKYYKDTRFDMNNFCKSRPYNINSPNELWFYQFKGTSEILSCNSKTTLQAGESCFLIDGSNISHIPSEDALGIWVVYK